MTNNSLDLSVSGYSEEGKGKVQNQDSLGYFIAENNQVALRGSIFAVADGISSSQFGAQASQIAVKSFLSDYLDTPETWSVKSAVYKVLSALNSWLIAQSLQGGHSFNQNKGYVCAFSAVVLKSRTLHVFNTGDVRVVMLHKGAVTRLTEEHRQIYDDERVYLSAALGLEDHIRLDYHSQEAQIGTDYLILSDGVYEYLNDQEIINTLIGSNELDMPNCSALDQDCAKRLCQLAVSKGSTDDVTALILRINGLPDASHDELLTQNKALLPIKCLKKNEEIDGLKVIRPLTTTPRSHTYLVEDNKDKKYVLKTPSTDKQEDAAHIEAMIREEWVARRLNNPHLMNVPKLSFSRSKLYTLSDYVEGQNLRQWMADNPKPNLAQVRSIIGQLATGLQSMHRAEVIHRDLRPENILIDEHGTVTIIDFGEVLVSGLEVRQNNDIPGSLQYAAPEYRLGEKGSFRSDIFSLGVLTYEMLSGHLPYGLKLSNSYSKKDFQQLKIRPILDYGVQIPDWVAYSIDKALAIDPKRRYQEVAEFHYELNHPSQDFKPKGKIALIERDPVQFWQRLSLGLFIALGYVLIKHYQVL